MFCNCRILISLDLSNFNTKKAITFENLFTNCFELISLDISNFVTTNVVNMKSMFRNCRKLTSLNLSNFTTSSVTTMSYMFEGCYNLRYLNLKNFSESNTLDITDMFLLTQDDIIYCIAEESTQIITLLLEEKICKIKDCDIKWKDNYENMIEMKKNDINVINDICVEKYINNISNYFY